ncbi:MAG: hypothetical protein WC642_03650 [Nocardioides sp.]|jgi:hypothetical protein
MNDFHPMIETEARYRIAERVARAAAPRVTSRPHGAGARLARRLRTLADRLDS